MKIVGIIAEYNPFHNGHAYQIQQIKQTLNADYVIVAMSGNFVQRGTPALTDKYTRAQMALVSGADLVIEIPTLWATASAEYFATAAVTLFKNAGIVTHLCFGTETSDLSKLDSIAQLCVEQPDALQEQISYELSKGVSYPTARQTALSTLLGHEKEIDFLSLPNNILAIEYLKALKDTSIKPCPIVRQGDGYHDFVPNTSLASATALRKMISEENTSQLQKYIPPKAFDIFAKVLRTHQYLSEEDFSQILFYSLWIHQKRLNHFADCSDDFADKIKKNLPLYEGYSSFCQLLKSKDLTYSRISRCMLHILLNITKEDYKKGQSLSYVPYLRPLGFLKDSSDLFGLLKKEATIPIISKAADAKKQLSEDAYWLLQKDFECAALYNQALKFKSNSSIANDFSHPMVIL